LGILSLATAYILNNGGSQVAVTSISTTIAFGTFVGILVWHAYNEMHILQMFNWIRKLQAPVPLTNITVNHDEEEDYREPLLAHQDK